MKHADFEKLLTQSLHKVPGLEGTLEHPIRLHLQVHQRQAGARISFLGFLAKQLPYIGWKLWLVQGLLLFLFDRMLIQLYGERFWDSPSAVARLLFCLSTLVAMMALPLLYRSRRYRMQEIESASYFSSGSLLMAKMAVIGIGDALLLVGMFLTTMLRTSMQAENLAFYLILPFLILSAAYLYMMGHCSGKGFFVGSVSLGACMILFALVLPVRWLPLFQQSMISGWAALLLVLLAFSTLQLHYLLHRSSYAELQVL